MTREEAKNKKMDYHYLAIKLNSQDSEQVDFFIDKIYDELKLELEAEYQRGRAKILALETANTDLHLEVIKFESRSCEGCLYKIGCLILEEFSDEQRVLCFQRGWSCSEWEQK